MGFTRKLRQSDFNLGAETAEEWLRQMDQHYKYGDTKESTTLEPFGKGINRFLDNLNVRVRD